MRVLALSVRAKNNDDSITMTKDFSFATVLNADKVVYLSHSFSANITDPTGASWNMK